MADGDRVTTLQAHIDEMKADVSKAQALTAELKKKAEDNESSPLDAIMQMDQALDVQGKTAGRFEGSPSVTSSCLVLDNAESAFPGGSEMLIILHTRLGSDPRSWDPEFIGRCKCRHESEFDIDDLENSWFMLENLECSMDGCEAPIVELEPEEILCECQFCRESFYLHYSEVHCTTHRCYGGHDFDNYQTVGSSSYFQSLAVDQVDFSLEDLNDKLTRTERADYWNVVTHYTSAQCFSSILRSGVIRAMPTGFFSGRRRSPEVEALAKAVCLTETPWEFSGEIRKRFGDFGFALERSWLQEHLDCAPTVNLPTKQLIRQRRRAQGHEELIYGWDPKIVPFVNKIDSGFDYLHEREWRVPRDIELDKVDTKCGPWLIMPDDYASTLNKHGVTNRQIAEWLIRHPRADFWPDRAM